MERVSSLQTEIQELNDLLRHHITDKRLRQAILEATDGYTPHPNLPEVTTTVYSGEAKPIHNEHQECPSPLT